jgi:glycosyltransferase involved in cell wall biosynthesis
MNILVTCLSKSWGGMEMFVLSSVSLLLGDGNCVSVVCLKDSPIYGELKNKNIPYILLDSSAISVSNIIKFASFLKADKYDLIHTHFSKDLWLIMPALWLLHSSIPVVMTKHLGSAITKKDFLHKALYNRLNHAIAISNVIKQNLIDTTSLSEEKVSLIYNYINAKAFKKDIEIAGALRKEFAIDQNVFVLGMVARITPGKGHEDVIESVKILNEKNVKVKVIVVGASEEGEKHYEESLKNKIKEYGLEEYFIFTGFRNDVANILSMFDVFLFPSHAEAFGLSLLEAMACGLPSIVCFSDGVKDIAIKGETSLTFERDDSVTLAENILNLLNDEKLRKKLSENSIQRAKYFSAESFQQKIDLLYKSLIKENKNN